MVALTHALLLTALAAPCALAQEAGGPPPVEDPREIRPEHASPTPKPKLASGRLGPANIAPLAEGETGFVLFAAKVFTMDAEDRVFAPGMVVVRGARVEAVGEPGEVPAGFERVEYEGGWVIPGLVDLHSHVHGFDNHDYVYPVNPELRTTPGYRPGNPQLRRACASGVTTLFGIPGSGGNMSGAGILHKTKLNTTYDEAIIASPGGLKIAQDSNPERRAYSIGSTRAGEGWLLTTINEKARRANERGERLPWLETLQRVQSRDLPVLIHTASSSGTLNTARMWRETYATRSVLSHGSFNGWKSARYAAQVGMPINNGPRVFDLASSQEGRFVGMAHEYHMAGVPLISMNTDAGVVPQEELFLQGAMASRYGADAYLMLRAVTIHPAMAFGLDGRLGSLEPGKDADLAVRLGDPLDPRARVEAVWIDGKKEFDRLRDGQIF